MATGDLTVTQTDRQTEGADAGARRVIQAPDKDLLAAAAVLPAVDIEPVLLTAL